MCKFLFTLTIFFFYQLKNKLKTKKTHTVGTIPKSNTCIKIEERGKMYTLIIQIHDRSLSRLGTDTSIKDGGVKLVLLAKISSLSEIMLLCQCFPHVCKSIVFVFVAVLYHDFIYQHSTCLAKLKTSRICSALIFNKEKKNREQNYNLNTACFAGKRSIPILLSLVCPDRGQNPRSTALWRRAH